jgi:hypothetical protein
MSSPRTPESSSTVFDNALINKANLQAAFRSLIQPTNALINKFSLVE